MSLSKTLYPMLSTGSTQEDPSDLTENTLKIFINKGHQSTVSRRETGQTTMVNSFHAGSDFCRLLMTFEN